MVLVALGLGALAALGLQSWTMLELTAVAYAALVAWDLYAGGKPEQEGPRPQLPEPRLPEASQLSSAQSQRAAAALMKSREQLARILEQSPAQVSRYLVSALIGLPELEERAARLMQREDELQAMASSMDAKSIEAEL